MEALTTLRLAGLEMEKAHAIFNCPDAYLQNFQKRFSMEEKAKLSFIRVRNEFT